MMTEMRLPIGEGIVVFCDKENVVGSSIQSSGLKTSCPFCGEEQCTFTCEASKATDEANTETADDVQKRLLINLAIDVIESMILSCACAGIDIESPAFLEAIETTLEAISNNV